MLIFHANQKEAFYRSFHEGPESETDNPGSIRARISADLIQVWQGCWILGIREGGCHPRRETRVRVLTSIVLCYRFKEKNCLIPAHLGHPLFLGAHRFFVLSAQI